MSAVRCLLILLCVMTIRGDDIERTARKGGMFKLLREMVNQTKADTLNLPANATSIRENITDTFSCENRTYGYYADVDNDCQIFHVCLTSQSSRGHNTTYRWSFICPNETMFNQEVLTCTRPRDSINCEDSPMYYHLNMEIGKMPNDTNANSTNEHRRRPIRKQKLVMQNILSEVKKDVEMIDFEKIEQTDVELLPVIEEEVEENVKYKDKRDKIDKDKVVHETNGGYKRKSRMGTERSLKNFAKKPRGSFKFKIVV